MAWQDTFATIVILSLFVLFVVSFMIIGISMTLKDEYPDYIVKEEVPCYDRYSNKIQDTTCIEKHLCGKGFTGLTNDVECKK